MEKNGITLIALVITIIVLLILAGIVINLTIGENGILNKTEDAKEAYKISEILEKLELEKVDYIASKNGEAVSVEEYVNHLINKEMITLADVLDIDATNKNIIVEGYIFLVEQEANGNIKITHQGKVDGKPRIAKIEIVNSCIDITVKVIASSVDGGDYKYYIKNVTLGEADYTLVATQKSEQYTFTNLPEENEYIIKVEVENNKGTVEKETANIKNSLPLVNSITLDQTSVSIQKGSNANIVATVLPENAGNKTLTWTSSDEQVATVDSTGKVTAVGVGTVTVTVAATDGSGITTTCSITVTPPPPPTAGVGGTTHQAKAIPYTWQELGELAKLISDKSDVITRDTVEVAVSINGKSDTLGIGDTTTVNGKKVRLLGFNHDELTDPGAYGGTNTYAGISFEFVDALISKTRIHSSRSNTNGWGSCELRSTLNNTTLATLENEAQIKQVKKKYIKTYNSASSVTTSNDYLWLLSCSEIWYDGWKSGYYGRAVTKEGERYKYYDSSSAFSGTLTRKGYFHFLRSPLYSDEQQYNVVGNDGKTDFWDANSSYYKRASGPTGNIGACPGFAI